MSTTTERNTERDPAFLLDEPCEFGADDFVRVYDRLLGILAGMHLPTEVGPGEAIRLGYLHPQTIDAVIAAEWRE